MWDKIGLNNPYSILIGLAIIDLTTFIDNKLAKKHTFIGSTVIELRKNIDLI